MTIPVRIHDAATPLLLGAVAGCGSLALALALTSGDLRFAGETGVLSLVAAAMATSSRLGGVERAAPRVARQQAILAGLVLAGLVAAVAWTRPLGLSTSWLVLLVGLSWLAGRRAGLDFRQLGGQADHIFRRTGGRKDIIATGRARRRLARRLLLAGILLLLAVSIAQARAAGHDVLSLSLALAAFAVLAITLLAFGRYRELQRRWQERAAVLPRRLALPWLRFTILLIGGTALVCALIPRGPLLQLVTVVGTVLLVPLVWMIRPLLTLLDRISVLDMYRARTIRDPLDFSNARLSGRRVAPPRVYHAVAHSSNDPRVFLVYAVLLLVAGYLIYAYWYARRKGISFTEAVLGPLRRLFRLCQRILRRGLETLSDHLPEQLANALPGSGRTLVSAGSKGSGSARVQVLRAYWVTIGRAERHGFSRRASATPNEYGEVVAPYLGDETPQLQALTGEFLKARYSPQSINDDDARRARVSAVRVRTALRAVHVDQDGPAG